MNFYSSVIYQGAHGGALKVDDKGLTFRVQKVTLPEIYRNMVIPFSEISSVSYKRKMIIFPVVCVRLKTGIEHRFIVFNLRRFKKVVREKLGIDVLRDRRGEKGEHNEHNNS